MADKEFEDDDPMELVGTLMDSEEEDIEQMGITFVEEFARMQWAREEILEVFTNPFYRAPHSVYRAKGKAFITGLIDCVLGPDITTTETSDTV